MIQNLPKTLILNQFFHPKWNLFKPNTVSRNLIKSYSTCYGFDRNRNHIAISNLTLFNPNGLCINTRLSSTTPWEQAPKSTTEEDSTKNSDKETKNQTELNLKEGKVKPNRNALKVLAQQYGPITFVTHIGISLISLGSIYLLMSNGIDVAALISKLGFDVSKTATGAGTFAAAYVVHKLIMPVRISITLVTVPFIVRYLRKVGLFRK